VRERLFDALLSLVAPPLCPACREALPSGDALRLCPPCARELPWLTGASQCRRCALPEPCGRRCPARDAAFAKAWAPVAYGGPAGALVGALKFRGTLAAADLMAAQIAATAPGGLLHRHTTLVPVPTAPARVRARGFDQAALLARALHRRSGLPVAACLRRRGGGAATRQLGAGAAQRRAPGRISFAAWGDVPRRAVLLDDVHTTGATLDAAARALRDAGCAEVVAVTYARAL
jgi:predicted amidophosphoribosyltransferase